MEKQLTPAHSLTEGNSSLSINTRVAPELLAETDKLYSAKGPYEKYAVLNCPKEAMKRGSERNSECKTLRSLAIAAPSVDALIER